MKTTLYTVTLKLRNEVGVLARISILLRKFQVNINSLEAHPIQEEEGFTTLTLVLENPKADINIVMKKLQKIIPVVEVTYKQQ